MFVFNADHHFVIGQDHVNAGKPCQDHALSIATKDFASAMVSDGCSSGGETDMGARVQNFALLAAIKEHWKKIRDPLAEGTVEIIAFLRRRVVSEVSTPLELLPRDALATSLYVYCGASGGYVRLEGDGVIAFAMKDGSIMLSRYDWASNMPLYPEYALDGEGKYTSFIEAHGGKLHTPKFFEESWRFTLNAGFALVGTTAYSLGEGIAGITRTFSQKEIEDGLTMIAVFTDGVTRIDGLDWKDAVRELLAFKNTSGEFVKRRLNRAQKNMRNEGKCPLDDLSYGVVNITEIGEEGDENDTDNATTENCS